MPPNYRLICKDRCSRGGSIAIAVQENLVCQSLEQAVDTKSVCCKLNFWATNITLGSVYREPGPSPEDLMKIAHYLIANTDNQSKLIIEGDFSAPNVSWLDDGLARPGANVSDSFLELDFSCGFSRVVHGPTCIFDTSCLLLDLFSKHFDECNVSVLNGISDHKSVYF